MATKIKAPLAKPVTEAAVQPRTISIRTRIFRWYVGLAAVALLVLAGVAHGIAYFAWDLKITLLLQSVPGIGTMMNWVSWPGYPPQALIIVVIMILGLLLGGLYWEAMTAGVSFGVTELIVNLAKIWVGRVRPLASLVNVTRTLSGGSFPSGHVVDYVVVLGFFWFLAYSAFKKSVWRSSMMFALATMIVLVGPSRIYLGAHWPSDVVGAYLLGSILLWLTIEFYRFGKERRMLKSAI